MQAPMNAAREQLSPPAKRVGRKDSVNLEGSALIRQCSMERKLPGMPEENRVIRYEIFDSIQINNFIIQYVKFD